MNLPDRNTPDLRPKRRVSTAKLARETDTSESFWNKLRVYGDGPPFLKVGRRVVYDMDDVEQWLELRRRRSTSEDLLGGALQAAVSKPSMMIGAADKSEGSRPTGRDGIGSRGTAGDAEPPSSTRRRQSPGARNASCARPGS